MAQESGSMVIEIGEYDHLITNIQKKIDAVPRNPDDPKLFSIFRVPQHIRRNNENCYEPRMVSIGPYHRGKGHLQAMEKNKWRYLRDFLARVNGKGLKTFFREMKSLEPSARRCYFESVDEPLADPADPFTEMMLLDGCFILELMMKWIYNESDVMCGVGWNIPLITSDLLMLDNQIPFFVLQKLYDLLSETDECDESTVRSPSTTSRKPSLIELVVRFLASVKEKVRDGRALKSSDELHHLLHLYYRVFVPEQESPKKSSNRCLLLLRQMFDPTWIFNLLLSINRKMQCRAAVQSIDEYPMTIPCATDLQEAGVKFKKASGSFLDITFSHGVLKIPHLAIEESTTTRFMNLIAFEQSSGQKEKILTSYAVFMNCVINTPKDIAILQQEGIIENKLANEKEASNFFNQLRDCSYIDYEKHRLAELFQDVRKYCELDWPKYRARMCRVYFNSPWSILSLAAALILLFLTVAQTFFAVFAYFRPPP
ncbi:UPF0481 protein At3g47200-like [Typha angustifolia]|uniref:UPF0481 protein At3g47200-like n=1 Tax=Typha angustifolia TaxID=59011 RepID=UPI003C2E3924